MRKKAIFFVDKVVDSKGFSELQNLKSQGYITTTADGNFTKGFEDTCDAVFLCKEFKHVREWAESKGIEVLTFKEEKAKHVVENKEPAEPVEEKPKPRGRKPASKQEPKETKEGNE